MPVNYPNPLTINQFDMAPVPGQLDLETQGNIITGQVDAAQVTPLVPGQAVKMATTSGGVPKFLSLAANTDQTFGFVVRNLKDASDAAYANFEVALNNSVIWLVAGAAITRGAAVEVVASTSKVITSAGVNPVVGTAFDTASVNGDLIRVLVQVPGTAATATGAAQQLTVTASLAEINAGKILIPGLTGKSINLSNYTARVTGTFATGTAVVLESTNGTPVIVSTIAEAGIAGTTVIGPYESHTTLGAGFAVPLGVGDGLKIVNSGSAQTGGTSIQFTFNFTQS